MAGTWLRVLEFDFLSDFGLEVQVGLEIVIVEMGAAGLRYERRRRVSMIVIFSLDSPLLIMARPRHLVILLAKPLNLTLRPRTSRRLPLRQRRRIISARPNLLSELGLAENGLAIE
jgi:hypothetical protein